MQQIVLPKDDAAVAADQEEDTDDRRAAPFHPFRPRIAAETAQNSA